MAKKEKKEKKVKEKKPPKEKKPKEKKPPKPKKEKAPKKKKAANGEGGKKGSKKTLLLMLILLVVVAAAAAAALFTFRSLGGGKSQSLAETEAEEEESEDGEGSEDGEEGEDGEEDGEDSEDSEDAEATPEPSKAPDPLRITTAMTTAETEEYLRRFTPASLGLSGESMDEYDIYAADNVVLVDGYTCAELSVYSKDASAGTNDIEGWFLLSRSSDHKLFRLDRETGELTELNPERSTDSG